MINLIRGTLATCQFELSRSFTPQRLAVSAVLVLFPGAMMFLLIRGPQMVNARLPEAVAAVHAFSTFAIVFLVSMVCILTLLLWAPANVYSELEGKSWGFLASRPAGRLSTYFGKFLTAFLVSFLVSVVSLSLCMAIVNHYLGIEEPARKWISLVGIYLLACAVYAAIFSMIGTIFIKRAMVVSAAYVLLSDLFLATVPAVVNKFTVRLHLQTLGISWLGYFLPDRRSEFESLYPPWPDPWHLASLAIIGGTCLIVGAIIVTSRQYVTTDQT
jgi:ABC-type transport system involved in multi-copper enzyme maturation permease subunit